MFHPSATACKSGELYPISDFPSPAQLLATPTEQQLSCGFSAAKLATILNIAQATLDDVVPTRSQAASCARHRARGGTPSRYPLSNPLAEWRDLFYQRLAPIANRWSLLQKLPLGSPPKRDWPSWIR